MAFQQRTFLIIGRISPFQFRHRNLSTSTAAAPSISAFQWLRDRLNATPLPKRPRDPTLIQHSDTVDAIQRIRAISLLSYLSVTPMTWIWTSLQWKLTNTPEFLAKCSLPAATGLPEATSKWILATEHLPDLVLNYLEPIASRLLIREEPVPLQEILVHTGGVFLASSVVYAIILYASSCFVRNIYLPPVSEAPADLQESYALLLKPQSAKALQNMAKTLGTQVAHANTNEITQFYRLPVSKQTTSQLLNWLYETQHLRVHTLDWHGLKTSEQQVPIRLMEKTLPGIQSGQRLMANTRAKTASGRTLYFWMDWEQLQLDKPRVWYALHSMIPWAVYDQQK